MKKKTFACNLLSTNIPPIHLPVIQIDIQLNQSDSTISPSSTNQGAFRLKWAGTPQKRLAVSAAIDALYLQEDISTLILVHLLFSADRSHGVSLSRAADDLLHHVMGARGDRGSVSGTQRTEPGVGGRAAFAAINTD